MAIPLHYQLPCAASKKCMDRFSLLDIEEDENGLVPVWSVVEFVLQNPVNSPAQLVDVLETLACTINGSAGGAAEYGTLKAVVDEIGNEFFETIWPRIQHSALQLARLFPVGSIPVLEPGSSHRLSTAQAASLVAHQFLCTLECPPWRDGHHDFSIWYALEQRHPAAAKMYLTALFTYFEALPRHSPDATQPSDLDDSGPVYSFHSFGSRQLRLSRDGPAVKVSTIEVEKVAAYSSQQQEKAYQGGNGAMVISANKYIGFGESATQEEVYVGNSPEACPAVLFTPPLKDDEILVIDGAAPMLRITGQRRNISWEALRPVQRYGGRILFMDALEIDEQDASEGLPDLKPENLQREIRKAYAAFSTWDTVPVSKVWTGIWGCGAFNGDPVIKMIIMWIAASLAGKELCILCDDLHGNFADVFRSFTEKTRDSWVVEDLYKLLERMPRDIQRLATIPWLEEISESL